jgi:hypothetical protein
VDISGDEYVDSIGRGVVMATWADLPEPAAFDVYPLEEITAEKLRCVMQGVQCRDIYDLFRLTEDARMPLAELRPLFEAKARTKSLDPGRFAERFEGRVRSYRRRWGAIWPSRLHSRKWSGWSGDTFADRATSRPDETSGASNRLTEPGTARGWPYSAGAKDEPMARSERMADAPFRSGETPHRARVAP